MVRRLLTALLAVLLLVACTEEPPVEEEPPISVSGGLGRTPVVTFESPLPLTEPEHEELTTGEGRPLEAGGPALLAISAFDGETGDLLPDRGAGEARTLLLTPEEVGEDIFPILEGTTEGTRLLLTQPVSIEGVDRMLVLVLDVLYTVAQGEELDQPEGLPAVSEDDDGEVQITLPDSDPPSTLEVWTVIRGDGPQVSPGQRVVLQYTAVTWPGGEIYDSTWADRQVPRSVLVDETFSGLRDGLTDQAVGSRTMIVVPPALGTGSQTLVFAVDILATGDDDV